MIRNELFLDLMRNYVLIFFEKVLLMLRFLVIEKMGIIWEFLRFVCLRLYFVLLVVFFLREKCGDLLNFLMLFDKIRNVFLDSLVFGKCWY